MKRTMKRALFPLMLALVLLRKRRREWGAGGSDCLQHAGGCRRGDRGIWRDL